MYLRTNKFTVFTLINVRDNDLILHSAGFDLCLSRQKYVIFNPSGKWPFLKYILLCLN